MAYWKFLGMARGTVTISRSERVWLELNTYATGEAEILGAEERHIPYRISLAADASAPGDAWYAGLARFTGLRELDLRNVTILPEDLSSLKSLPRLTRLWLPEPDGALAREKLVARAAHAGMFESGRNRLQGSIYFRREPVDK